MSVNPIQRSSTGVGAFAFQGTNAHALLVIMPQQRSGGCVRMATTGAATGGMLLERRKHWPLPNW